MIGYVGLFRLMTVVHGALAHQLGRVGKYYQFGIVPFEMCFWLFRSQFCRCVFGMGCPSDLMFCGERLLQEWPLDKRRLWGELVMSRMGFGGDI